MALFFLLALAIVASLLVFPGAILWMVAGWLVIASFQSARKGTGWLPLAICAVVLVVKRPDWSPALIALGSMLFVATIALYSSRISTAQNNARQKIGWATLGVVWIVWLGAIWQSYDGTHMRRPLALDARRPIVCLGDSLTSGLTEEEAYPKYLQELVSVPVVDWGKAGVTARDMTTHLPEILESRPQAVVIELGGHDFLRGYGRGATLESLATIIERCQDIGAAVVLVEVPRGFISDLFSGLERELSRKYDLELISDSAIRMFVVRSPVMLGVGELAKPHLSDDGLHPNVVGARFLATTVFGTLNRMYGSAISATRPETQSAGGR